MDSYSQVWWSVIVPNKESNVQVVVAVTQTSATIDKCRLNRVWDLELILWKKLHGV